jgi:predicted dehydrogenase
MNIGICGLGNHAINNIAPALMKTPKLELAGVFTRNEAVRSNCAENFNCKTWKSYEDMLEDKSIDIIYCSTPPALHYQIGLEALSAGKHFWCEKPITMSLQEARSLVELSNKAKLTLAEGFMYMYHPHFRSLKNELIKYSDEDIRYIDIVFTLPYSDNIGFRDNLKLGGSAILDIGTYNISLALQIFAKNNHEILYKKINIDDSSKVDVSGFAAMQFNETTICNLFWGMGFGYRNEINILTKKGSLYTDKIFSKKEDYEPIIQLRNEYGEISYLNCKKANHFVEMFSQFRALIDDEHKARLEKERIIDLSKITEEIRLG